MCTKIQIPNITLLCINEQSNYSNHCSSSVQSNSSTRIVIIACLGKYLFGDQSIHFRIIRSETQRIFLRVIERISPLHVAQLGGIPIPFLKSQATRVGGTR